jgi:hypothetical protein
MLWPELMKFWPADLGTKMLGLVLASTSAAFPFYIYNNPGKFGPPRMEYAAVDSQGSEGEARKARFQEGAPSILAAVALDPVETGTAASSPPAGPAVTGNNRARNALDGVMTGSVALPRPREMRARQAPPEQPFPGDLEPVDLLFVSAGGALMMAEGGIEIVGEGSDLPDGSRVLSIREKNGGWEILTTGERVLRWRKN